MASLFDPKRPGFGPLVPRGNPLTTPTTPTLGSLLGAVPSFGAVPAPSHSPPMWIYVRRRFTQLIDNLAITENQRVDGEQKQAGVRACLNRHYWNAQSNTENSFLIGSWGKRTRVRPSRDVDILFLLPSSVYHQYQVRQGNRQSQLLQEAKEVLVQTYSRTARLRADGQVVVVPFNDTPIEVSLGFLCADGSIIVCDTNDEGRYKASTAKAEAQDLDAHDAKWNGNVRALARMMKRWQKERNVDLKSFQLERLAIEFLSIWPNSHHDIFWYDWMVRDFLAFLIGRANTFITMPGTGEQVWLGNNWLSKAQTATGWQRTAPTPQWRSRFG